MAWAQGTPNSFAESATVAGFSGRSSAAKRLRKEDKAKNTQKRVAMLLGVARETVRGSPKPLSSEVVFMAISQKW